MYGASIIDSGRTLGHAGIRCGPLPWMGLPPGAICVIPWRMRPVRITVVVENTTFETDTLAEHGLAFWIESDVGKVLFDAGQTPHVLTHNARRLGIDLGDAAALFISHGHSDHTGGLVEAVEQIRAPIFLHPHALIGRYCGHDQESPPIGMPGPVKDLLTERSVRRCWTRKPTEIVPDLFATGPVPRETEYEDTGGDFYVDFERTMPDLIADDQAMFFHTPEGTVVLLGCAHSGVINTIRYVRVLTGDRPIYAVIGGMHLKGASDERLTRTVEALREEDVAMIAPAHCSGFDAAARIWAALPGRYLPCRVGTTFEFEMT